MPTKTHIEDAQRLVTFALSSSRARKYKESGDLIRMALHFMLEDRLDQEHEEKFADLFIWKSLSPTPKHLQDWSNDFHTAVNELNENENSLTYIYTMQRLFEYELISAKEKQTCFNEVADLIDWLVDHDEDERSENDSIKEILSTSDVAKMFGVTSQTVLMWCKAGRMPGAYQTPGGTWKVPRQSLKKIERLLNAGDELDSYIYDQEALNAAVSRRRKAWRK